MQNINVAANVQWARECGGDGAVEATFANTLQSPFFAMERATIYRVIFVLAHL